MTHRWMSRFRVPGWLLVLLSVIALAIPAQAQLLAVLDKSKPTDAGLSQAKLNVMTQAVRGEVRRRVPEEIQILTEESTISILRDMGVNLAECEGECEVDIARKLQADWLISVSIVRLGEGWTLQLNLFETISGALKGSERGRASREEQLEALALEKAGLLALLVGRRADSPMTGRLGGGGQDWEMPLVLGVPVTFESTPPGATVTLDGSYLGETPLAREVAPGPHSLKFSLARYEDLTERVTVDKKTTLRRTLTPLFGWLNVESSPSGQVVYLDGSKVGDTPLTEHVLGHGPHTVLVGDSARVYPVGERFTLGKGEKKSLRYDVLLRTGGLVVRCADAQGNVQEVPVTVDGTERGVSPLQLKLPIGEHTVEADGQRQTVRLREKQIESLSLLVERATITGADGKGVAGPLPGMFFVTIPAGTFQMGSPANEQDRSSDEMQHTKTLSSFAMMTTEVTQAQWQAVMGSNPSYHKGNDRPVEQVSWNDVQAFITKLNRKDPGMGYRLPSEAEWEYACRAGSKSRWCFGEVEGQLVNHAWYDANSTSTTHPVGQLKPNAWGLFDMHGNVWEWCQDWYAGYGSGALRDPRDPDTGSYWVFRGGGWSNGARYLRSAGRNRNDPALSYDDLGFRLSRTP
jgi:formylglycine-generating enzyme required for sulfatase activity